jgi:transcriptional regulator with XRE-family HTH domain
VGKNIAAARTALDMTQTELGQAMKLSRGSIAKIETGAQRHLSHSLTQFALVLGTKTDALLPKEYQSDSKVKAKPESAVTRAEISEVNNLIEAARTKLKRIGRKKGAEAKRV